MRAVVTNDDGVDSPGVHALAAVANELGLEVVLAAPAWDSSGASASLTSVEEDGRFLIEERVLEHPGLDGVRVIGVHAAPAFIVRAAASGAFGPPPDIVLSGINRGRNTGHAILHSGTVGAALTGSTHGCRGLAVSLDVDEMSDPVHWDTAAVVANRALSWLVDVDRDVVLNVNVPNLALDDMRGIVRAKLASFGAVQTNVTEVGKGYVRLAHEQIDAEGEPGTDAALLAGGYASVTPLISVCEASGVDVTPLAEALAV